MQLGVCYYPEHWPEQMWAEDFKQMKSLGISHVRIGEFAWSRYEPSPGLYQWEWLERALDQAHAGGLKVILGTPTATPPHWLIKAHPEVLPLDHEGKVRGFGSRRHYCFSSKVYRELAREIVERMAQRFGSHPALSAWQTDNEYGCHDTIISYSKAAQLGFQSWCRERYGSIEALNEAWGNVFWSMEYQDFQAIELPMLTVTEANPSHRLAFWRYSSDQVRAFNQMQTKILRKYSPTLPLVHNYMGFFTQFDHFDVAEDLDIASWDSYPLGFLDQSWESPRVKETYLRTGHPDHTAFHHDLYRGVGRGRWWVMEQQPGPVNWAPHNPAPLPGMVRLWTFEAFAHGAELVSYFRWRQAPFAQEQFHAGLHLPNGDRDQASFEVEQVHAEIKKLQAHMKPGPSNAKIALVFDYPSEWILRVSPQGKSYDPLRWSMEVYAALRSFGQNIDIVPAAADLSPYRCVVLPNIAHCSTAFLKRLKAFQGSLVIGPRTGSKTAELQIPQELPPAGLQDLIPLRVRRVESLPPQIKMPLSIHQEECFASFWREEVETKLKASAEFADGWGALYEHRNVSYLSACFDFETLRVIFKKILEDAAITLSKSAAGPGLRLQERHGLSFAFNYGPEAVTLSNKRSYLVGSAHLKAAELAIWKTEEGEVL